MRLEMGMGLEHQMLCIICDEPMPDHKSDCVALRCEEEAERRIEHKCPACRKWAVGLNDGDYFECRKCNTQFSASMVCAGEDPDTLEKAFILKRNDEWPIEVLVMKNKGIGKFPHDEKLAQLCKAREEARERALLLKAIKKHSPEKLLATLEDLTALLAVAGSCLKENKIDMSGVDVKYPKGERLKTIPLSKAIEACVAKGRGLILKLKKTP